MGTISTHVLDLARGTPAQGLAVKLEIHRGDKGWVKLVERRTDDDGRAQNLIAAGSALDAGRYRLTFGVGEYFRGLGSTTFFAEVPVEFEVRDADQKYHVPLLVSPFGYSTYRGS